MPLPFLHLPDQLPSGHLNLLFFSLLSALFHFFNFLIVASLFHLSLLPLLVSNLCLHLNCFLSLLLFKLVLLLLLLLNALSDLLLPLLNQTQFEPLFERVVALLLSCYFLEALLLFLLQLLLTFECLLNYFFLLPFVHSLLALLIYFVLLGLLLQ